MTVNVPGPFCSMTLGDLGAKVFKIEPPGGDPLRHNPGMWASLNRGKQSIVLDLKAQAGQEALQELAAQSDIVLEGWRPGVANRLGADYLTLSKNNPALVYCSISGFGQEGPWRDRPGHDINYLALSGYLSVQSMVEGRPWPPPILVSDLASGLYAAISVLASLTGVQRDGKGSYLDLSMTEAALSLLGPEIGRMVVEENSTLHPNVTSIPTYGLFPCADGRWLSLGIVHEDHFWKRLCKAAQLQELANLSFTDRLKQSNFISKRLHTVFLSKQSDDWEQILTQAEVPAAVVVKLDELFNSPQFMARNSFVNIGEHRFVSHPVQSYTNSSSPSLRPPVLGEHTDSILLDIGYDTSEISQLRNSGIFGPNEQ